MTVKEIYDMLLTLNIPVAYDHFITEDNVTPPFITYRNTENNYLKADNINYHKSPYYIIDLVTEIKDTVKEDLIENLLNENELPYDKMEDYIGSEKIYQIRYFI